MRQWIGGGFVFLIISLVLLGGSLAEAQGSDATAEVRVVQGRVTVRARSAPLAALLRELGRQSGLPFVLLGTKDHLISISFEDRPLDDALRSLMRGNGGGALVYEESSPGRQRLVGAYLAVEPGGPGIHDVPAPSARDAAAVAAAEERLRSGGPEDFLAGAAMLYPDAKNSVEAVYATATRHPDPGIRQTALGVIAEVGSGEKAQRVLEEAANDLDPGVQAMARRMLGSDVSEVSVTPAAGLPAGRRAR